VAGDAPMPPLLEGRYPVSPTAGSIPEIALGRRAIEQVGGRVGDTVDAMFLDAGETPRAVRIVGVAVIPIFGDSSRLGHAALIPPGVLQSDAGLPADFAEAPLSDLFVAGHVDLEAIARVVGDGAVVGNNVHRWPDFPPTDVVNFGRVQDMPLVLGLLLALFAAATLAHTLITAISRRRRDLAILKTIGFVRAQVRRAVRAQSIVLAVLAFAIGAPVGVASGRWLWTLFAQEQGVVVEPVTMPTTLIVAAIVTPLVALVIAALPARAAARTRPALVLRSE